MSVYVGTYTRQPQGHGEGIYAYDFDPNTGALKHLHTTSGVVNPSFLTLDANGSHLYAVNEGERGQVTAFRRDPESGELHEINTQVSEGDGPCYVSLSGAGRHVLVANYGSGSIAALPIQEDGGLQPASSAVQHHGSSVNPNRQEGPHAHMIAPAPDGRFILAVDLGLDRIFAYHLDPNSGSLAVASEPAGAHADPGSGPRHFASTPDHRYVYVINELASTLTAYEYDAETAAMRPLQTESSLPADFSGQNTTSQVVVSPDGRYVYGSNRGDDSIAFWAIGDDGGLTFAGRVPSGGKEPRNFNIDPTGRWLLAANQNSDTIVTFRRDADSGNLEPTGEVTDVPTPVCIVFA